MNEWTTHHTGIDVMLTQRHWIIARELAARESDSVFSVYVYAQEVARYLQSPNTFRGENDPLFLRSAIEEIVQRPINPVDVLQKKRVLL